MKGDYSYQSVPLVTESVLLITQTCLIPVPNIQMIYLKCSSLGRQGILQKMTCVKQFFKMVVLI